MRNHRRLPPLTLAVWFWAVNPTHANARESDPLRWGPINDGGADEFPGYQPPPIQTSGTLQADQHEEPVPTLKSQLSQGRYFHTAILLTIRRILLGLGR